MKARFATLVSNLRIAADAILHNKLRTLLTALGIIFGVAAVITMMAIGTGAREEIMNQMKLVGTNNIVIDPRQEDDMAEESGSGSEQELNRKSSTGLTLSDVQAMKEVLPTLERISPEISMDLPVIANGKMMSAKVTGVSTDFFGMYNFSISEGEAFSESHNAVSSAVCVIGKEIETKFFSTTNAIGNKLKCGEQWLTVVGVLQDLNITEESMIGNLGIRNYNREIFVPVNTVLLRFKNMYSITESEEADMFMTRGIMITGGVSSESQAEVHELDRIVVQVTESEMLLHSSDILSRLLKRRHNQVNDFEIIVPYDLLKQKQKARQQYNVVLGAIAGISLLVGGIGIMNIMLASVLERVKEIGVRKALGATRKDIVQQFLIEAMLISFSGGIIGVLLGVSASWFVEQFRDIVTVISWAAIVLSFGVSALVGVVFGLFPARKAAYQDVIESLRHE
jgi:putative ABC transport system permease protein